MKHEGDGETRGEEGERLRPRHGVARADEAGRPQDDEKAGWWAKAVQLDLEAKGVLKRMKGSPVRLYQS
jgi:hypothetical protein